MESGVKLKPTGFVFLLDDMNVRGDDSSGNLRGLSRSGYVRDLWVFLLFLSSLAYRARFL